MKATHILQTMKPGQNQRQLRDSQWSCDTSISVGMNTTIDVSLITIRRETNNKTQANEELNHENYRDDVYD